MILPDSGVLACAHRTDTERHEDIRAWLEHALNGSAPVAVSEQTLSGFVRIVTDRKVFREPTPADEALRQATAVLTAPAAVRLRPGSRHWAVFAGLCAATGARGPQIAEAFDAALVIEHGCTWVTADRSFARFPGLDWRHPLDD